MPPRPWRWHTIPTIPHCTSKHLNTWTSPLKWPLNSLQTSTGYLAMGLYSWPTAKPQLSYALSRRTQPLKGSFDWFVLIRTTGASFGNRLRIMVGRKNILHALTRNKQTLTNLQTGGFLATLKATWGAFGRYEPLYPGTKCHHANHHCWQYRFTILRRGWFAWDSTHMHTPTQPITP